MPRDKKLIAIEAPVTIKAAEADGGSATFDVLVYNGGALSIAYWDKPVVIDLAGLKFARSVVANLDHREEHRVGHVTEKSKSDGKLTLGGVFSAATQYRDEVVESAQAGFTWEASIEVSPIKIVEVEAGKAVTVNGQEFTGPLYITRTGTLSGFAFVSHGADVGTDVKIAAEDAAQHGVTKMRDEVKAWVAKVLPSVDIEALSVDEVSNLEADFDGRTAQRTPIKVVGADSLERRTIEAKRRKEIVALAEVASDNALEAGAYESVAIIRECRDKAIKAGMSVSDFRYELRIAEVESVPPTVRGGPTNLNAMILEAAICQAGNLPKIDKQFPAEVLQVAHDMFKSRISLNEALIVAAEHNGYTGRVGNRVDNELHNYAFGMVNNGRVQRGAEFSTLSLPSTFANTANRFMRAGWDAVDQTPLRIAYIRSVNDFKQITTVSLTGSMQFLPVGPDGEIKHGSLGEATYTNQVTTAGIMFAITRVDYRNDDIGALTTVPRRIGRGGMLYLSHIFWTEFLNPSVANFWSAGNNNVNTGIADMTIGGLAATEAIFMNQTDPDGKPLMSMPAMLVVPPGLKAAAETLMGNPFLISGTGTATQGSKNIYEGRFKVESSPYMANSSYTGYSPIAWYMLADPDDMPVIEIAALDGNVIPTVETADTTFNTLGVQMRGYSDVGVKAQEPKGGVRADGNPS